MRAISVVLVLLVQAIRGQGQAVGGGTELGSLVGGLLGGAISAQGRSINAISYTLPSPPALMGTLAPNNDLINAEKVHYGLVNGPSSFVFYQGELYAGTRDNKIYNMARCKPKLIADLNSPDCVQTDTCGQLTSLRRDPTTGDLIALDTYRGVFRINITTGAYVPLYSVDLPVGGRVPVHLNDMVVTNEGMIIMTDSSDTYEFGADMYIGMEGRPTGRLIWLNPKNGATQELLPNFFVFPNGIELTPDGSALLVAETGRVRIQRVSLQRPTWLQITTFSYNLPGLPDNIRASDRGTFWVGMSYPRHTRSQNPMDQYSSNPVYRRMGAARMSYTQLLAMFSKWGMAVEINAFGAIIKTLQDPTGTTMSMVSEVAEFGGVLNIGSPEISYMARIVNPQRGAKVDSLIAIARSRCQLEDAKVEETRKAFEAQLAKKTSPPPKRP
ncbi:adipocyte plasma membrane-associated protein-like [Physella acuta]|uniref:adipocyte plasma membrane-associated protein-like n=1 Tax=Physella acuta TaxID=109671 RepID=UPI0027DBC007|nr:adipocyte plasma membrane-associated protein-like [Physella acuta]